MSLLIQPKRRVRSGLLAVCFSFFAATIQQRNPIENFCRRWGHQTAVVDDKLYIDGGMITWDPMTPSSQNYTNPFFLYHDLTAVASSGMPPPVANLSKNSSIPSVQGGVFWPDDVNKRIYLYGGEFYGETPWPFALYAYDIINDLWEIIHAPHSASSIRGLSYGAGLSIASRGEGYYYGGWMNDATDPDWEAEMGITTSFLLRYSMDTNTWTNQTGPDDTRRAEGAMVFIPAGDGGFIVYFGGIRGHENGTWEAQPMQEIILFDVLSGKSYIQNATGETPPNRRRFCAGASWVEDQSSYSIFLYGGAGEEEGSLGFDDVYILTLPTFTWIRMYPESDSGTGDFPHHSLSCNVVNEAQMIIHGGYFPGTINCDAADQWGLHNLDLGQQNPAGSPWALYEPNKTRYVLTDDILAVVGGRPDGGATNVAPEGGFMHADLEALMTRTASIATRTPTRAVGGHTGTPGLGGVDLSDGAIAGIATGGAVGLTICIVVIFCLVRRYRRKRLELGPRHPMIYTYPAGEPLSPYAWNAQTSQGNPSPPAASMTRPQSVPPYGGPPVELPSEGNELRAMSPYPETSPADPKHDPHGLWRQMSATQGPGSAPSGSSHKSLSSFSFQVSQRNDRGYAPARSPRDMDFDVTVPTSGDTRGTMKQTCNRR
ncbi:hypothetical protein S40288_09700 [Stachybotrys chartarum IBT 40288]|nr:hypothetical protein S40288_09700 [Stachybotrys chartarum IBT 40288]